MKQHGPWKIKNSRVVYKNRWLSLREDEVINPKGEDGIFSVVTVATGINALPLDSEGFVYLTKEFNYGIGDDNLEVIGGAIEGNEKPEEAAKREIQEETGITASKLTFLGMANPLTTSINSPQSLFLAEELEFGEASPEDTEEIEVMKISFEEAVEMVMANKITHAPSALVILKTKEYLSSNGEVLDAK